MANEKPTGKTGAIRAEVGEDGKLTGGFKGFEFPKSKDGIEYAVFSRYVEVINSGGTKPIKNFWQNPENDFDFTIILADDSKRYVDLAEVLIPSPTGPPHDAENVALSHKEMAERIMATIRKKSRHYGKRGATPVILLLYNTHFRFVPSFDATALVRHWLRTEETIFDAVKFVAVFDSNRVHPQMLYPVDGDPLDGRDPMSFQDLRYIKLDLSNATVVTGEGRPIDKDSA